MNLCGGILEGGGGGGRRVVITHSSRHCKCPDSARRALEVAGGWRGAASGKGGETTGGDERRRDERYGDRPLQARSIQKLVAMGRVAVGVGTSIP